MHDQRARIFTAPDVRRRRNQRHWVFSDGATSDEQKLRDASSFRLGQETRGRSATATMCSARAITFTQTYAAPSLNDYVDSPRSRTCSSNSDKNDQFGINSNAFLGPCVTMTVCSNRWGRGFETRQTTLFWDGRNFHRRRVHHGHVRHTYVEGHGVQWNVPEPLSDAQGGPLILSTGVIGCGHRPGTTEGLTS